MINSALQPHSALLLQVFDFFTSEATDPKYYQEIKEFGESNSVLSRRLNNKPFLQLGYLGSLDFTMFAIEKKILDSVRTEIVDLCLKVLVENIVLIRMETGTINNTATLYKANEGAANYYKNNNLLLNKIFGFDYIIDQYIGSVVKIENTSKKRTDIGNGFLISSKMGIRIITNFHVLDKAEKLRVLDKDEKEIEIKSKYEDESLDLAYLVPKVEINESKVFLLNENLRILEDILTIGYPPVPQTKASYPLFHKGEINSFVQNYSGNDLFLFSAKTNPGNSGSPIIDGQGSVVGIITQQLEEKDWYKESKIPYYAGIPSSVILQFVERASENESQHNK